MRDTPSVEQALGAPASVMAQARSQMHLRPGRATFELARCWVLIGFAFGAVALVPTVWMGCIAFFVIGTQQNVLAVLIHEGQHGSLFGKGPLADLFVQLAVSAPLGADLIGERATHFAHHRRLGTPSDPDRHLHCAQDKATSTAFLWFLTGRTALLQALLKASRAPHADGPTNERRPFLVRSGILLLVQAALCTLISLALPWWCYLLLWLGPIYPLVFLPVKIRAFCEHAQPLLPDEAADEQRLISYQPSWIERLILAPLNVGLHAEHHLWPGVPFYNLRHLTPLLKGREDVIRRGTYLAFLVSYYRRLPLSQPGPSGILQR